MLVIETSGEGDIRCLTLRGEYVYAAQGKEGFWAYDAASIANKGFSHRVIRAPVSPLGQNPGFSTKNATCVQLATTQPVHWDRNKSDFMRVLNQEQPMHEIYRYAFINGDYGSAAALSVLLAAVLALLSAGYLRLTRRWSTT